MHEPPCESQQLFISEKRAIGSLLSTCPGRTKCVGMLVLTFLVAAHFAAAAGAARASADRFGDDHRFQAHASPAAVSTGTVVFKVVDAGLHAHAFAIGGKSTVQLKHGKTAVLRTMFAKRQYKASHGRRKVPLPSDAQDRSIEPVDLAPATTRSRRLRPRHTSTGGGTCANRLRPR